MDMDAYCFLHSSDNVMASAHGKWSVHLESQRLKEHGVALWL